MVGDFITKYLKHTEDTEQPKLFHVWSAVSLLAGAMQRRFWLPWGQHEIFPNMFIVLVGPSGVGKSQAMKPAIELFEHLDLPLVAEAITPEELAATMGREISKYMDPYTGKEAEHCSATIFAKELSVLLGQRDLKRLAWFTDWYDSNKSWKYETKTQGKTHIKGVCLNLLGATAPDWLPSMFPIEVMGGGFTARTIFVHAAQKERLIAIPKPVEPNSDLRTFLLERLHALVDHAGKYHLTADAETYYTDFYHEQEEAIQQGKSIMGDAKLEGYLQRRSVHLLKLAMVMSASRGEFHALDASDIRRAKDLLVETERHMPRVFRGVGRSELAQMVDSVLAFVKQQSRVNEHHVMRARVASAFYRDLDAHDLDMVERTLVEMGAISLHNVNNEKAYRFEGRNE